MCKKKTTTEEGFEPSTFGVKNGSSFVLADLTISFVLATNLISEEEQLSQA